MNNAEPRLAPYEIYPRYCFDLAPTHNIWCFLRGTDVKDLTRPNGFSGQDWYFFGNIPVRWVRIVGVVVAVEGFSLRRLYTIDDSSGACIEAMVIGDTSKAEVEFPYDDVDVGAVVYIKGCLTTFREEKQIKIEKLVQVRSTIEEVALWEKRNKFYADILAHPWVLSPELVLQCRRQAERSEQQAEKRAKRKKTHEWAGSNTEAGQQDEQRKYAKTQKEVAAQNNHKSRKQQHAGLSRSELAMLIRDSGVQGHFGALGL